eukprot:scaffold11455_cov94-Cylindrotheca_fusiformis.AAC.3
MSGNDSNYYYNKNEEEEEELSEYERKRLERIAKNEAYLESIGLGRTNMQKLKDMCRTTNKNAQRRRRGNNNKAVPNTKRQQQHQQRRRSKRLRNQDKKQEEEKHIMLSYYDDDNEKAVVISQDEKNQSNQLESQENSPSFKVPSRSRRSSAMKNNRADFTLTTEEKQALESKIDDTYLDKFKEFLVFHDKISEQNVRNVMRQVSKLARGDGIRYESPKGQPVTPISDIVALMEEAQDCEDRWGRDRGNGWLLSHPLKKLLLFQQFCLNNPDFLTTKCKLAQYYEMAATDNEESEDEDKDNVNNDVTDNEKNDSQKDTEEEEGNVPVDGNNSESEGSTKTEGKDRKDRDSKFQKSDRKSKRRRLQ